MEYIKREHSYPGKGAIDIYIQLKNQAREEVIILLEVKVHDYLSATRDQIKTYIEAARSSLHNRKAKAYFIYLTQFTGAFFNGLDGYKTPGTVVEFNRVKNDYAGAIVHISWNDFYRFLEEGHQNSVSPTIKLLLDMQKSWMTQKMHEDLLKYKSLDNFDRALEFYFPNTLHRIDELIPLGNDPKKTKTGEVLEIDLTKLTLDELNLVASVIWNYAHGPDVDKTMSFPTEEVTRSGAAKFLAGIAKSEENWPLLSFYAQLFHQVSSTPYLHFNGNGTKGFSLRLKPINDQNISLCTMWNSKNLVFRLSR